VKRRPGRQKPLPTDGAVFDDTKPIKQDDFDSENMNYGISQMISQQPLVEDQPPVNAPPRDVSMEDAPINGHLGTATQETVGDDSAEPLTQEMDQYEQSEQNEDILGPDDLPPPFASTLTTPAESDIEDEADRIAKQRFDPMTDPNHFVRALTKISPSDRSIDNLLALALNTQLALKAWQDEYLELDKRVSLPTSIAY